MPRTTYLALLAAVIAAAGVSVAALAALGGGAAVALGLPLTPFAAWLVRRRS
ncbi:MAG: hypothetical protein JNK88_04950 [Mangrovicoccus sp.]|nr:hypothetical protein [Mangrovicoccus sp.]